MRLLPTPVLSFTDIHIGDAENPDVEMERFRAEVELAPLLKGEVRIIQMAVERPRVHVDIGGLMQNRGLFSGEWRLDPDRISLERLEIVDGVLVVDNAATGQTWEADGVDATIEATSLRGPARVDATLTLDDEPLSVRANFGRYSDLDTISMNLFISSPNRPVTLSTEGTLHLPGDAPPSYEGEATVEGVQTESVDAPRTQWADFRASGAFSLEPADLTIEEMQISYGAIERPLIIEASGQLNFGDRPRFDIALGARQIDLDRTLAGGEGNPFAIEAAFSSLVEMLPRAAPPPLPGSLRLQAQGVVVGGSVVQSVGIDLVTAGNSWVVEDFTALLPGDTRVDLTGTLGLSADTTFRGHARIMSDRPGALAAWWRGTAGTAARIGSFVVEADLDLSHDNQSFSSLVATTSEGAIEGSIDIRQFPQSGLLFMNVGLSAERADLVETRALAELLLGKSIGAGKVDQLTLSLTADVLRAGGIEARSVVVEGGLEEGRLNFRRLSVADLAGASINAHGSIQDPFGTPSGRADASVKADDISGAAKFLLSVLPESQAVRRLEAVAPILSPMSADISAEAGAAGERVSLELSGSFADTHLSLSAEGVGSLANLESLSGTLRLHAVGEDSAKVLTQLGFDVVPVGSAPLVIDADFDGALASAGKLKVDGTAAGINLAYTAETSVVDGRIALAGDFTASTADIDLPLMLAGIAVPGMGEGHAVSAAGQLEIKGDRLSFALSEASFDGQPADGAIAADLAAGIKLTGSLQLAEASLPMLASLATGTVPKIEGFRWSDTPFSDALPPDVSLDFTLGAERLDIGAPLDVTDASLDIALDAGKLSIDLTEGRFAGGTLKGSAGAIVADGQAEIDIQAGLEGAGLQSLVWERIGLPVASGALDLSFEATGRGRTAAGIVSTLSGSGSFTVTEGRLNALNAEAIAAVMAAAEGEREPDETAARETFASLFGSGALAFGRATGSFSIVNGAVGVPTVSLSADATKVLADATFDLNTLTLESDWTVRLEEGEQDTQPYVTMTFRGPIMRPTRQIDLVPLMNQLRSRFLQNKLQELEELQRARDEAERRQEEAALREAEAAEETARQAAADELTTGATGGADTAPAAEVPVGAGNAAEELSAEEEPEVQGPPTEAQAAEAPPTEAPPAEELPPGGTPEPDVTAPAPEPAPAPRRQTPPPASTPAPEEEGPLYRTLPNGVTVKIR